jgi:hypothetical protein
MSRSMRTRMVLVLLLLAGTARAEDAPPPGKPIVLIARSPDDRKPLEITAGILWYAQIPLALGTIALAVTAAFQGQTDNGYCCKDQLNPMRFNLGLGAHGVGMFSLTSISTAVGMMIISGKPYASLAAARQSRGLGIFLVIVGVLAQAGSLALDASSWSHTSDSPDMTVMAPAVVMAVVAPIVTGAGIALWVRGAQDVRHAEGTSVSASPSGLTVRF